MSSRDVNLNSSDAMFAKVIAELSAINGKIDGVDRKFDGRMTDQDLVLSEIKTQTAHIEKRTTKIEQGRWQERGFLGAIAMLVPGGWALFEHFHKP